ncbi:MAG: zinc-ribbon domain-containing protein [Clostridiales bacterium]|nr:zinc-ribbon domain-containing protein [Clostridiales bacterium]
MFCPECGKEIADGSVKCPECGKALVAEERVTNDKESSPKTLVDVNVGAFIKDLFKNPIEAVVSRSKESYWVWGIISLAAFVFVYLLRFLFDSEVYAGESFGLMFALLCAVVVLVFSLYLFQGPFKIEKRSLPTIVSAVGLSMVPMVPIVIVASIMDFLFLIENSFFSIFLYSFMGLGYIFSAMIINSFFSEEDDTGSAKSMMLVIVSFALFIFTFALFSAVIWRSLL